ncbi:hypothetical protein [Bathymodiolus platifrons methanotrophic gill symbiont]|uniref:hypothetical protein n=1 Tax=Bathymodiolus platifrons methanotrophic gill symbiont TaxID=113268 RepID=UPI001E635B17|nr:hypothetical protein [Bathymodiolus platifrons methanotrophic gill symbiont]
MSFPYKENIEKSMKKFYDSLCEKNKRRYAAIESEKLSHGGVNYISALLECDPKTIRQGKKELTELELDITGIRQPGGGRKKRPLPLNTWNRSRLFRYSSTAYSRQSNEFIY